MDQPTAATRPDSDPQHSDQQSAPKPVYTAPRLRIYGSLGDLTATVGPKGRRDGRRSTRRTGY